MFAKRNRATDESPIEKYVDLILRLAAQVRADKIIFGEPCDNLPRDTAKLGQIPELLRAAFIGSPDAMHVPLWARVDGVWHEWAGPPWYLLHEIVRAVGDMHAADINLAMEPNFCYSLTLREAD